MTILFLVSAAVVFYAYLGYPLLLMLSKRKTTRMSAGGSLPSVSVLMCANNAEGQIRSKLENLVALEYPSDLLEIIVVCDGCTDHTADLVRDYRGPVKVRLLDIQEHSGKAAALNAALRFANGEICFMVDVRQRIEARALKTLVRHFSDPDVGAVSGELVFVDESDSGKPVGVGVYWKFEKQIRRRESLTGSVIGATGAVYAVRRDLIPTLPKKLILDDVFIPMHVIRAGKRVLFEPGAVATDKIVADHAKEFDRKVRTLYGNLQLVEFAPWLIGIGNPALGRFVSHKLLRILVPVCLALMLASSFASHWLPIHAFFWVQLAIYSAGLLAPLAAGPKWLLRALSVSRTFLVLNAASAVALMRYLMRRPVVWRATKIEVSRQDTKDEIVRA